MEVVRRKIPWNSLLENMALMAIPRPSQHVKVYQCQLIMIITMLILHQVKGKVDSNPTKHHCHGKIGSSMPVNTKFLVVPIPYQIGEDQENTSEKIADSMTVDMCALSWAPSEVLLAWFIFLLLLKLSAYLEDTYMIKGSLSYRVGRTLSPSLPL